MDDSLDRDRSHPLALDQAAELIDKSAGYDIRHFSEEYARKQLNRYLKIPGAGSDIVQDPVGRLSALARQDVITALSTTVTSMFRDADFYTTLRQKVLPELDRKEKIRIWQIGCATGEESYSVAITLNEMGLRDRYTILATDFNRSALRSARRGIYDIAKAGAFTENYHQAGGDRCFSDYYSATNDAMEINSTVGRNIRFYEQDVTAETVGFQADLVICRNVLIYFSKKQQIQTINLFLRSLRNVIV